MHVLYQIFIKYVKMHALDFTSKKRGQRVNGANIFANRATIANLLNKLAVSALNLVHENILHKIIHILLLFKNLS